MTITQQIIDEMQSLSSYAPTEVDAKIWQCANHVTRRLFRCWLDGSYNGCDHYQRNCERVREANGNQRKLRSFVIGEFVQYMAADHDCSFSTSQRAIVRALSVDELERLNIELIDDALDLIAD